MASEHDHLVGQHGRVIHPQKGDWGVEFRALGPASKWPAGMIKLESVEEVPARREGQRRHLGEDRPHPAVTTCVPVEWFVPIVPQPQP